MDSFDIVIIGGGTAGPIAAIQAARAGARVLLVEKEGILGGTMITAGVNAPASFHSFDRQVIAGIGWDLVRRTLAETGQPYPAEWRGNTGIIHVDIDRAVYAALADEAVVSSGAEVLFHTMLASARFASDRWQLQLCTKEGLRPVEATVLIDCTGDANAVTMAGLEVERPAVRQPGTLIMHFAGYDAEALDYDALQKAFDAAVAAGRMQPSDTGWFKSDVAFLLRHYGGNRVHVTGIDGSTSTGKTAAEIQARQVMLRIVRFCRAQPGLESFRIASFATECGIRETVVIRGKARITADDYLSGRLWDDAVCYCHYSIDIHEDAGLTYRPLERGVYPTIPLRAMIPAGSRQLIVAGRCISGDREAHSAYRVEAPCMAMGQAAGAAAALAVQGGCDVGDVPLDALRALLAGHDAIVPHVHEPIEAVS